MVANLAIDKLVSLEKRTAPHEDHEYETTGGIGSRCLAAVCKGPRRSTSRCDHAGGLDARKFPRRLQTAQKMSLDIPFYRTSGWRVIQAQGSVNATDRELTVTVIAPWEPFQIVGVYTRHDAWRLDRGHLEVEDARTFTKPWKQRST